MTGEFARVQLSGVAFANLVGWLDAQRRENRISVQDAAISAKEQAAIDEITAALGAGGDASG